MPVNLVENKSVKPSKNKEVISWGAFGNWFGANLFYGEPFSSGGTGIGLALCVVGLMI